ncbi:MAG: PAS domain S-box protein, partial [Myxococcales bacterium]|nr:PAS domain S-box protein [Myxococcales bacterium]
MTRALDGPAPGEPRGGPVQAAGAAIVATGLDGTIQSFNPAAERLTGYSAADLIGTHSITMLHLEGELRRRGDALSEARGRETASLLEALVAPARRSGAETRAWTYERVDGLPVRVLVTTSVARDDEGALAGFVFVSQPTSEPPSRRGDAVLLGQLVDSSRVAIMSASLDGYVLSWNAAAARLLGYDREEILGQHVGVLFPTERRHEIVSMLRRLLQEEDALVLETTRVRKDGERVAVQLRLSPVLDGDGVPLGVSIIALPRERPRGGPPSGSTENARYRALFESSASFAAIVGVDGFFKAFNPIWSSVFGFSERELRAQPVLERVHPEDRARTVLAGRSLVTDGAPLLNVRARFLCAGGGHRWLSWNANPDLEAGLIYAIAHDITELVETRERLRESERQLLETGRIARLGGWELDVATGRVHWSDVVRQIHEVPPDFEPTLERALEFYAEEERPRIYAAVQRAVAEGESWDAELAFTSARGRSMWVRAKAEAERERPDGRVLRVRGTLQDITERKELDRLKDEFVSVVSHELRTPLTSIR